MSINNRLTRSEVSEDFRKFPKLRDDIKISKMVNKTRTHYVVKDPLKGTYFRFGEDEWQIIKLFDGSRTLDQIAEDYNKDNEFSEIDSQLVEDYWSNLNDMYLLIRGHEEMNVMLVEKVREMRQMQLLSKKGSIMYKRFPIVDPDKFFDRIIPHIKFFWSRSFFIFSLLCMIISTLIIIMNWSRFNMGLHELFNFSEMSFSHLAILWIVIYLTIAIHELGHGLTCKYFGGEVHEIGFLLLFFQPCLYANVNDAWLFDKKWKQILVTIAGGYIEYFIGSIATFIWVLTNPNTFINVLSFQIMTIASLSTIMFNFNPLIKLDGYYLLSDFLETPNLKEESGSYLKHVVSKYIFRMPEGKFHATKREKKIYLIYGIASAIWMFLLLTGLVGLAKGILVEQFNSLGIIMTCWIAYKIFSGHITKGGAFLMKWFLQHRSKILEPKLKKVYGGIAVCLILLFVVPIRYQIKGSCNVYPSKILVLRPVVSGEVTEFYKNDGEIIKKGQKIFKLRNLDVQYGRQIASLSLNRSKIKLRKTLIDKPEKVLEAHNEIASKKLELSKKNNELRKLEVIYNGELGETSLLSCNDQEKILGSFYKEGDEICRLLDLQKVTTVVEISEQDVGYINLGNEVDFKLFSRPSQTYTGKISRIRPTGKGDPKNPTRKIYQAEIILENNGELLSGMEGMAKIYGSKINLFSLTLLKASKALRMDLFF
jgi:putative peptide zinc metalloprotease protein